MEKRLTIEDVCRKLKPLFGNKIDDVYLKYALAEGEEREELVQFLNALYNRHLGALLDYRVLLEPPLKDVIDGNYELATVSYADRKLFPFRLREQDWQRHVCISGMSGSGKTTFAFNILAEFIKKDKPFLVFDWKKSFRPLLSLDSEMICFTVGDDSVSNFFKMNVNRPPKGIDPKEWINILCDMLVESFSASFGVHKVLLETLDRAFEEWGVYDGSENYPTWRHIKWRLEEKMEHVKSRESGWVESALRIASVLTFGNFGDVCNSKEGALTVEDLMDKRVLFELNSLGNIEKKFFCEFILTYIYKLKKSGRKSAEGRFEYAILVDEAHNIFLKKPTTFAMESVTDMIYREMREYGVGLVCIDQHISKLSDTIKGNSSCHVAFQQQLPQDVYDISNLMQLRDYKHFFTMLPVGSAIVRLSERYTFPFLIEVSRLKLKSEITDRKISDRAKFFVTSVGLEKGKDRKFMKELVEGKIKERESDAENHSVKSGNAKNNSFKLRDVESHPVKSGGVKNNPVKADDAKEPTVKSRFRSRLKKGEKFDAVQKELHGFVEEKMRQGKSVREIESILERRQEKGGYSARDIGVVVNSFLENAEKKKGVSKSKSSADTWLVEEQEALIKLLKKNSGKSFGTTEIYRKLGFTPRKGNEVKNKLLDKKMIKVKEVRSSKGWKKIIRLV